MRRAAACWGYALLTSVLIVGCAEEDLQAAADAAALASANDAIDEVAAYGQTSPAGWPDSEPIRSGLAAEGRQRLDQVVQVLPAPGGLLAPEAGVDGDAQARLRHGKPQILPTSCP